MNNGAILPVIPENITVHLGRPTESARNVTVPFADYIKNVASSEIYPTWPENALRANILAQISFTLNRIYTEYYRSRGYDFDITNSTAFDQSFVYGRDIFENISQIVDEIFNEYIRRSGSVEPLFAVYCDGINVQCNGVSQWGSVELANQGLTPYEILQYYYGDRIELVTDVPVVGSISSYPGTPLRLGSNGDEVYFVQTRLNRISRNYPNIPKIANPNGLFSADTEDAVKAFQRQFNLTPDGIVGSATWYAISRIYTAVKRLADINSEGISLDEVTLLFNGQLSEGSSGLGVRELQVLLAFIAQFDSAVIPVTIDGIFGSGTRASVESFQYEYGLPVTGTVDAAIQPADAAAGDAANVIADLVVTHSAAVGAALDGALGIACHTADVRISGIAACHRLNGRGCRHSAKLSEQDIRRIHRHTEAERRRNLRHIHTKRGSGISANIRPRGARDSRSCDVELHSLHIPHHNRRTIRLPHSVRRLCGKLRRAK